jgi:hypothetical protein
MRPSLIVTALFTALSFASAQSGDVTNRISQPGTAPGEYKKTGDLRQEQLRSAEANRQQGGPAQDTLHSARTNQPAAIQAARHATGASGVRSQIVTPRRGR